MWNMWLWKNLSRWALYGGEEVRRRDPASSRGLPGLLTMPPPTQSYLQSLHSTVFLNGISNRISANFSQDCVQKTNFRVLFLDELLFSPILTQWTPPSVMVGKLRIFSFCHQASDFWGGFRTDFCTSWQFAGIKIWVSRWNGLKILILNPYEK